ncbi:MAG TPA: 16S rRNA (cytosine(1402)-N(4))-methyltransferase RsmH [Gemmatimonadaceae bacterium]|nr:16S rRNA (cytosine(1402)-N(4))-methyltransferase RsmH [Gemmatimonadaceae bacterium]
MSLPPESPGRWDSAYHAPVMVAEVLDLLGGLPLVLDCTLGGGGHSAALLESGSSVRAVDRDPAALATARARLAWAEEAGRFAAHDGNYSHLERIDALAGVRFDGILLDLGISSHQIDDTARGFSFREGAALDMRMGDDAPMDAATLLSTADERELARIFHDYGDERRANALAREIVRRRARRRFDVADDLVGAIRAVLGPRSGPAEFARLFQAVRIAVNDELAGLERALPDLRDRLHPGGVLVVIAYHSGEDRLVKQSFRAWSTACTCPPRAPVCTCGGVALGETLTRKALVATDDEISRNPRARSARLRAWRSAA